MRRTTLPTTSDMASKIAPPTRHQSANQIRTYQRAGREPYQLVEAARKYTMAAVKKLAILGGLVPGEKLPKIKVLDKEGRIVEVDQEIPAAVQLKALELLLERGYGKAPQAILLTSEPGTGAGGQQLSIEERIAAIRASREAQGQTTDLEASEVEELQVETSAPINVTPPAALPAPQPYNAADAI